MDRDILERQITKAEEQVAIAAQNVARQRELVAQLERDLMNPLIFARL